MHSPGWSSRVSQAFCASRAVSIWIRVPDRRRQLPGCPRCRGRRMRAARLWTICRLEVRTAACALLLPRWRPKAGGTPEVFLDRLNRALFTRTERCVRPEGAAQRPAQTLAAAKGACRDLTVLFMSACRSLGIAARFVSGYQAHAETPDGRRHLHAWAEVFLPGSGWHGFDPMHGLPVTDGHVALCAAPDQAATMPVEGGYYGNGVTSTLDYKVLVTAQP